MPKESDCVRLLLSTFGAGAVTNLIQKREMKTHMHLHERTERIVNVCIFYMIQNEQ